MTLPIAEQNSILRKAQDAVCGEIRNRREELLGDPAVKEFLPKNVRPSTGWFLRKEKSDWIDIIAAKAMGPVGQALYEDTLEQNIARLKEKSNTTAIERLTLVAYASALQSRQASQMEKEPKGNAADDVNEDVIMMFRRQAKERKARGGALFPSK